MDATTLHYIFHCITEMSLCPEFNNKSNSDLDSFILFDIQGSLNFNLFSLMKQLY